MRAKLCYVITLVLTALLMGLSFAHTLELPAKMRYDAFEWTLLQQTLYQAFAYAGGAIELAAIAAALVLAYLLRAERSSCVLAAAGAGCLIIAFFGVWLFVTERVNVQTATWALAPVDWMQWRARWEYSHAARFVLHLGGFMALAASLPVSSAPLGGSRAK